jgi:rhodanese-related sulfurtransferase
MTVFKGNAESHSEIDVNAANDLLEAGSARLIDVREEWEFRRRRVPGAALVPLNTLIQQISALPNDKPILVICEHGTRSLAAAEYLRSRGFAGATSVRGGTDAWARRNLPIEFGEPR